MGAAVKRLLSAAAVVIVIIVGVVIIVIVVVVVLVSSAASQKIINCENKYLLCLKFWRQDFRPKPASTKTLRVSDERGRERKDRLKHGINQWQRKLTFNF